jgi:hypothetical protein
VAADNKLALNAGWDRELLAIELRVGRPPCASDQAPSLRM